MARQGFGAFQLQTRCPSILSSGTGGGREFHIECWRELHQALQNITWDRSCIHSLFHKNQHRLDSERHKFLDCPLNRASRLEFFLLTTLHFFFDGHRDKKLAVLVARVREDPLLLTVLARFSLGARDNRRHFFRQLSLDAQRAELDLKLNRLFRV